MIRSPGRYSIEDDLERLRERQAHVLGQMVQAGFITPGEAEAAAGERLVFRDRPDVNREVVPQFTEHVRRLIEARFGDKALYEDGLKVYATVDVDLQAQAHRAVWRGLTELSRRHGYRGLDRRLALGELETARNDYQAALAGPLPEDAPEEWDFRPAVVINVQKQRLEVLSGNLAGVIEYQDLKWALAGRGLKNRFSPGDQILVRPLGRDPKSKVLRFSLEQRPEAQAALVCLDGRSGEVKAMIGGRDFAESKFNRAVQAHRQPGSAFKPFVYAAAMDLGFTPADVIWDEPIEYEDHGKIWAPQNYDRRFEGPTTLYTGLVRSRNVVAVRLLQKVGLKRVIRLAQKMGIKSRLAPYLSLALGASEVTPLEMTAAFTTFPNLGSRVEPGLHHQSGRPRRPDNIRSQTANDPRSGPALGVPGAQHDGRRG